MARDFLSDQIKTKKIIGDNNDSTSPKIAIYPETAMLDNVGNVNTGVLENVGEDVFLFVSGAIDGKANNTPDTVTLFGGDVVISGTLYAENQIIEVITEATGALSVSGSIEHTGGINIGDAEDGTYTDGLFTDFNTNTLLGTVVDRFNEVLKALAPAPAPVLDFIGVDSSNGTSGILSFGSLNDLSLNNPSYTSVNNITGLGAADVNTLYTTFSQDSNNRLGIFNSFSDKNGVLNEDIASDTYSNGIVNYPENSFGEGDIDTLKLIFNSYTTLHEVDLSTFTIGSTLNANGSGFTLSSANSGVFSSGTSFDTFKHRTGTWHVNALDQVNGMNNIQIVKRRYGAEESYLTSENGNYYEIVSVNGTDYSQISDDFANTNIFPNGWDYNTNTPNIVGYKFLRNNVDISTTSVAGTGTIKKVINESVTGYAEWVNDNNQDALSINSVNTTLNLSGSKHLSGVEYFTGGNVDYNCNISNFYKYVYGNSPVTFSTYNITPGTSFSFPDFNIPPIDTNNSEDHNKILEISTTSNISLPSNNKLINANIGVQCSVTHPFKTINSNLTQSLQNQILIDNTSATSNETYEGFDDENYRLLNKTYNTQSDVVDAVNVWDSTQEIVSSNADYSDGLLIYNGLLQSTEKSTIINLSNFSNLSNGPLNNPDYSISGGNISSSNKTYIRKFTNTTGSAIRDISFQMSGNGNIINHQASFASNNDFKIYFKKPGDTAWLDASSSFVYNNVSNDGDGGSIGTFNSNILTNPLNYLTFGTTEVLNNENILVKVESDHSWQGYLNYININFGITGNVNLSPDLDNITSINQGVEGNLSFGSSLPLSNYSNVTSIPSGQNSLLDANDTFTNTNNRIGIFDSSEVISGKLNDDISSSGNSYGIDAWGSGKAHIGFLKLEINGSIDNSCTIDLSTFTSGDTLNANGSGFVNITAAEVSKDNNNLPDYRYFWRSGEYKIETADQRLGFNYIRVYHDIDGTANSLGSNYTITNYIEWLNDNNSNALSATVPNTFTVDSIPTSSNTVYLSGVRYWDGEVSLSGTGFVGDLYSNVYSNQNNSFTLNSFNNTIMPINQIVLEDTSNNYLIGKSVTTTSTSLPLLNIANIQSDANYNNPSDIGLNYTVSFKYVSAISVPGNTSGNQFPQLTLTALHPLKNTLTQTGTESFNHLIYALNDTETNLIENASAESYRLIDHTYNLQSDVTNPSNQWDSTIRLNSTNIGHNTGLMMFDNRIIAPNIDFTTIDFLTPSNTFVYPDGNANAPDYTTGITGTRTFYRKFQNKEVSSKFNFTVTVQGVGTLIDNNSSLGSNNDNFRMFIKLPTTSNSQSTGWLDFRLPFQTGQISDNDGCRTGGDPNTMTNTLSAQGTVFEGTFGTQYAYSDTLQNGDYVVLKIEADSTWTGRITNIELEWR